jgi:hypothetical protein
MLEGATLHRVVDGRLDEPQLGEQLGALLQIEGFMRAE